MKKLKTIPNFKNEESERQLEEILGKDVTKYIDLSNMVAANLELSISTISRYF